MSLLNRLRPKWQNSDPDVRAAAVRALDKDEVELLTAVAQGDGDPRVRRIAIKKLEAPRVLLAIASDDGDDSVRDYAQQRARQLLVNIASDDRDIEESKRALALIDDPAHIASVAEKASFNELQDLALTRLEHDDEAMGKFVRRTRSKKKRRAVFERISDQSVLRDLALDPKLSDLALSAVDRIEDVEILESLATQPSASKAVRRHARIRLDGLIDDDHPIRVRERETNFRSLLDETEELAEALSLDRSLWERVRADWSQVCEHGAPPTKLAERFEAASAKLQARLERSAAPTTADEADTKPSAKPVEPSATTDASAESASSEAPPLLELSEVSPAHHFILTELDESAGQDISAAIERATTAWDALAPIDDEHQMSGARSRLQDSVRTAEARLASWEQEQEASTRRKELVDAAEKLLSEPASQLTRSVGIFRRLDKSWSKLGPIDEDPEAAAMAGRFETVRVELVSRHEQAEKERLALEKTNYDTLSRHCARIEDFLKSDGLNLKKASDELRMAQDFLKDMGPLPAGVSRKKQRQRLRDLREKLFLAVQEARENDDWKRWANVDIQKALIDKLEQLRASKDFPKVAKEMRQLHAEWRKSAAAPSENAEDLWQRYKTIRDELTEKCNEFFQRQDAQRGDNLTKKTTLCERAEALESSEEWNKTAEALKALQEEWKKIGPVPQKQSDALWARFRGACNKFFERRKEILDSKLTVFKENLAQKIVLCEQAEALRESTDWNQTASQLKKLQADWKNIGPVPHKKSESVWKRFRTACDYFFDRFKRKDEIGLEENVKQADAILAALDDTALSASEPDVAASVAVEQWTSWKSLGALPSAKNRELRRSFHDKVGAWLEKAGDSAALENTELAPSAAIRKSEKLCQRAEKLVKEFQSAAPAEIADLDDLASRLKNALASNTIAGRVESSKTLNWKDGADQLQRLRQNWERAIPLASTHRERLDARFAAAVSAFSEKKKAAGSVKT